MHAVFGLMKRILIVEDNDLSREALSRRLVRSGYETLAAADGRQGLAIASALAPDLILMDLGLPEIDGWECVRRLRASASTCRTPIIALTAHATLNDRDAALSAGCDEFDTKPIDYPGLLAKMTRLLDSHR